MPDNIHLMPASLANLIAAGEVVERPASVVKELVENSIDASATHIQVDIEEGGLKKIVVRDDGCGMNANDARMCLLRHASSKIKSSSDLEFIHTMGFRGEAIPSIVSVSHFEMSTSDGVEGTKVDVTGEEEPVFSSAPLRQGTTIRVNDLFYNTPARLKYMKGANTERAKCIDACEHLAIGFPNVSFSVITDGKEVFSTTGRGDVTEVIQRIWGNGIAKEMKMLKEESVRDFSFEVFMANPEVNYSTKYQIMTFLNNRFIYSYKLSKAVEEAYRDYLAPLRYPFVVVLIKADPMLVDVNVHPAKREVRISEEEHLSHRIKTAIAEQLKKDKPVYSARSSSVYFAKENSFGSKLGESFERTSSPIRGTASFSPKPTYESQILSEVETNSFQGNDPMEMERLIKRYSNGDHVSEEKTSMQEYVDDSLESNAKEEPIQSQAQHLEFNDDEKIEDLETESIPTDSPYADLCPIGQIAKTYIICESPLGLCVMDQHAAAERVNFERIEKQFKEGVRKVQPLFPMIFDFPPSVVSGFDESKVETLRGMGLEVSIFGDSSLKVDEVPSFLVDKDYEEVLRDMIVGVVEGRKEDPAALLRKAISTMACKASVRAGDTLSPSEQISLIRNLNRCKNPANCPHGRPTVIKISIRDLEKLFKRTGF